MCNHVPHTQGSRSPPAAPCPCHVPVTGSDLFTLKHRIWELNEKVKAQRAEQEQRVRALKEEGRETLVAMRVRTLEEGIGSLRARAPKHPDCPRTAANATLCRGGGGDLGKEVAPVGSGHVRCIVWLTD